MAQRKPISQKLADRIKHYIEVKGNTQTQAAKRFKIGKSKVSELKKCKFDAEIYHEFHKGRQKVFNENRYKPKEKTTYDKLIEMSKEMGYKTPGIAIQQMGVEKFREQKRNYNI